MASQLLSKSLVVNTLLADVFTRFIRSLVLLNAVEITSLINTSFISLTVLCLDSIVALTKLIDNNKVI